MPNRKRILMLRRDLGVKQYHLACSLVDELKWECQLMLPRVGGLNWYGCFRQFPRPKQMLLHLLWQDRSLLLNQQPNRDPAKEDYALPFSSISRFSKENILSLEPDLIYLSSDTSDWMRKKLFGYNLGVPVIVDVEDSMIWRKDIYVYHKWREMVERESQLISNDQVVKVAWASDLERIASRNYYQEVVNKDFVTLYPFVAKRTIPTLLEKKTDAFSVVYLGSSWLRSGRDYFPFIKEIVKNGVQLTIFLINSVFPFERSYAKYRRLARRYENLEVNPCIPYAEAKSVISKFHVGLVGALNDIMKYRATFGMKPLEYAFANVQPASLGIPLKNLSNGKEFGYVCAPETIESAFVNNLKNFDYNYHLMDNHLGLFENEEV